MKKTFTYRGFVLKEGKSYKWSGYQEGLYTDTSWTKLNCKVVKIEGNKVFIEQSVFSSDPRSQRGTPDETVAFTKNSLEKNNINFY